MGDWNLKEFKTLCLNSGLDKVWFYTESLAFKWRAATYHKSKIQQKIDEINSTSFLEKAPAYDLEIAFALDALMVTLNSMWDILGQLINECFIRPKIDASKMYFDDIFKCYWNSIPPDIQPILKPIRGNTLYRTIKAFADVSKHRHAIQGEIHMDVSKKAAKVSYVTTEFEYKKGEWHKLTLDNAFKCWEFVDKLGKSIDEIGAKIHELVKQ
jgi:hypothetical protein